MDFAIYCETNYTVSVWTIMSRHSSGDAPFIIIDYRCTCWGSSRGLKDRTGTLGWCLNALFGPYGYGMFWGGRRLLFGSQGAGLYGDEVRGKSVFTPGRGICVPVCITIRGGRVILLLDNC